MVNFASVPAAPVVLTTNEAFAASHSPGRCAVLFADPLDHDRPSDHPITLTDRQLARLLFIAAETGGRFERDGAAEDPVAWLFSPLGLFGGRPAVQACQEAEHFLSAVMLHRLACGHDACPVEMSALLADDECDEQAMPSWNESWRTPASGELSTA